MEESFMSYGVTQQKVLLDGVSVKEFGTSKLATIDSQGITIYPVIKS